MHGHLKIKFNITFKGKVAKQENEKMIKLIKKLKFYIMKITL